MSKWKFTIEKVKDNHLTMSFFGEFPTEMMMIMLKGITNLIGAAALIEIFKIYIN
jgi:hypothetical protein